MTRYRKYFSQTLTIQSLFLLSQSENYNKRKIFFNQFNSIKPSMRNFIWFLKGFLGKYQIISIFLHMGVTIQKMCVNCSQSSFHISIRLRTFFPPSPHIIIHHGSVKKCSYFNSSWLWILHAFFSFHSQQTADYSIVNREQINPVFVLLWGQFRKHIRIIKSTSIPIGSWLLVEFLMIIIWGLVSPQAACLQINPKVHVIKRWTWNKNKCNQSLASDYWFDLGKYVWFQCYNCCLSFELSVSTIALRPWQRC